MKKTFLKMARFSSFSFLNLFVFCKNILKGFNFELFKSKVNCPKKTLNLPNELFPSEFNSQMLNFQ